MAIAVKLSGLIEALNIFLKYGDLEYPTQCEHDELTVFVDPSMVSEEDIRRLDELGFTADEDCFKSSLYGSA